MNSIQREKYSSLPTFYLFSFLLFLTLSGNAQEILWSHPGLGEHPRLTLLGSESKTEHVLVSSPFGNKITCYNLENGKEVWNRTLSEHLPFRALPLTNAILIQGDQGMIWALQNKDGDMFLEVKNAGPRDYPIAPPTFYNKAVFTLSHIGKVRKINKKGEVVVETEQDTSWGQRKARPVPLLCLEPQVRFLDQSGRLVTYNPETLAQQKVSIWPPVDPLSRKGPVQEALAGAISTTSDKLWVADLSGYLQAFALPEATPIWKVRLASQDNLWSSSGELLVVPTPIKWDDRTALLVASRNRVRLFNDATGETIARFRLASPAVCPPVYDRKTEAWWILCERHVVSMRSGQWHSEQLPIVEQPFSMTVLNDVATIGVQGGRIYGVLLTKPEEKIPDQASSPAKR